MFTSHAPEDYDPQPWAYGAEDTRVDQAQGLELRQNGFAIEFAPRPEFLPTRDPMPWGQWRYNEGVPYQCRSPWPRVGYRWDPRELDPVTGKRWTGSGNPILIEFRRSGESANVWLEEWGGRIQWCNGGPTTREQRGHAHKVLERLAAR